MAVKKEPSDASSTSWSQEKLGAIRTKLATDYSLWLRSMMKVYSPKGEMFKELQAGLKLVQGAVYYVDVAMGKKGRVPTEDEISLMSQRLSELNAQMQFFAKSYAKSKKFKSAVDRISADTGQTLGHLESVSGMLDEEIKTAMEEDKEGLGDYMKRVAPEASSLPGRFGKSFATAALGPFAPLGELAWGAYSGIRKDTRQKKLASQRKSWMSNFGPGGIGGLSGDVVDEAMGRRRAGTPLGSVFTGGGQSGGVEEFFSKKAYETGWTKEVLASLKKMSSDLGNKGTTVTDLLLMKILAFLPGILLLLGKGALVAGAGIAGWQAGRWIGENVELGGKSVDKWAQGGMEWMMGATPQQLMEKNQRDQSPAMNAILNKKYGSGGKVPTESTAAAMIAGQKNASDALGNKLEKITTDAKKSTAVVPKSSGTTNRHKDSDPLTDSLNRTSED